MGNLAMGSRGLCVGLEPECFIVKRWAPEASPSGSPCWFALGSLQKLGVGKFFVALSQGRMKKGTLKAESAF